MSDRSYRLLLTVAYGAVWLLSAVNPHYFADWLLENMLVIAFAIVMAISWKSVCLSKTSNTLIFVFLCLHSVGAHHTYALVPYNEWSRSAFGFSFNDLVGWERNNYDRVVHFSFGLLLAYPLREVLVRFANLRGGWSYLLPFFLVVVMSTAFEHIEWAAALIFGGDLGQAYLGTQGDEWDSHKDTLLASAGAFITTALDFAFTVMSTTDRKRAFRIESDLRFN
ncbi:MAG: DUF2238 domain-containing protein [Hyphomicrobiales bacterium]